MVIIGFIMTGDHKFSPRDVREAADCKKGESKKECRRRLRTERKKERKRQRKRTKAARKFSRKQKVDKPEKKKKKKNIKTGENPKKQQEKPGQSQETAVGIAQRNAGRWGIFNLSLFISF